MRIILSDYQASTQLHLDFSKCSDAMSAATQAAQPFVMPTMSANALVCRHAFHNTADLQAIHKLIAWKSATMQTNGAVAAACMR
jgi:hypothetical protein